MPNKENFKFQIRIREGTHMQESESNFFNGDRDLTSFLVNK